MKQNDTGLISELSRLYPDAGLDLHYRNSFELLIAVILSAQCTDERVNKVTETFFRIYKTPRDILDTDIQTLEQAIRPTGFFRRKALILKECCRKLVEEFQGKIPANIDEMTSLPGVGRKTAAMVLGNAFRIEEGIAVDTHVKRVVNRLKLSVQQQPEKIEQDLMRIVPRDKWTFFSNSLIQFGRNICTARKPDCPGCPFNDWCPFPEEQSNN
ncbi:MAG: endonuclease III [Calditrichaeota bacterium]|nr:MAG: endonuclease III [Calditrichota bacterium]